MSKKCEKNEGAYHMHSWRYPFEHIAFHLVSRLHHRIRFFRRLRYLA